MSAITPALSEVGALIRARTKDTSGVEQGTFTTGTRPTAVEAQALIDSAEIEVFADIGPTWDVVLDGLARRVVAVRAAQYIERSYFPEQATEQQPAFLSLRWQFEALHTRLIQDAQARALSENQEDEDLTLSQIAELQADVVALQGVDAATDTRLDTIEALPVWREGVGVPSNSLGKDTDLYLRTSNGDVYKRTAGTYAIIGHFTP